MDFRLGEETRFETVAIRVKDRDAMIAFYRDIIGFTLKREENELAIMGNQKAEDESLWLEESPRAEDFFGEQKKLQRISLVIPTEAELADLAKRIRSHEYPIVDALWDQGVMGILLNDPEGNQIEVYYGQEKGNSQTPEPLQYEKLAEKATGAYPKLSPEVHFDKVHLNTAQLAEEDAFLRNLGFAIKDETTGIRVLNEGRFHVGLTAASGGTVELKTDDVLGLDFLKFRVSETDLQNLIDHLQTIEWPFYVDKKQSIVTVYDPTGIEWWFTK